MLYFLHWFLWGFGADKTRMKNCGQNNRALFCLRCKWLNINNIVVQLVELLEWMPGWLNWLSNTSEMGRDSIAIWFGGQSTTHWVRSFVVLATRVGAAVSTRGADCAIACDGQGSDRTPKPKQRQTAEEDVCEMHSIVWINAQIHKFTNTQMHRCTDTQMHRCTNAQKHKCTNPQMQNPTYFVLYFGTLLDIDRCSNHTKATTHS